MGVQYWSNASAGVGRVSLIRPNLLMTFSRHSINFPPDTQYEKQLTFPMLLVFHIACREGILYYRETETHKTENLFHILHKYQNICQPDKYCLWHPEFINISLIPSASCIIYLTAKMITFHKKKMIFDLSKFRNKAQFQTTLTGARYLRFSI